MTVLAKAEPGSTYNIGCSAERRNIDMAEDICDLVDDLAGPLPSGSTARAHHASSPTGQAMTSATLSTPVS